MSESATTNWEEVPDHPDPAQDLGYEVQELTVVRSAADSHLIFLPKDEDQLREEEFIVVSDDSLRDVER